MVSALARVEGEGALDIVVRRRRGGRARRLQIYEPPRFFEAFLRGRQYTEVTDITSRICGICPVAYQTSAPGRRSRTPAGSASARRSRPCGGCCTAVSGSPATRCTSTSCTPPTSSATRTWSRWPAITGTPSSGAWPEEGRQRDPRDGRRPGHPPGQPARRRLLPGADRRPIWRALGRAAARGPGRRAGHRRPGWPGSTSRTSEITGDLVAVHDPGRYADRGRPRRHRQRARLPGPATSTSTSSSTRCRTPPRCTPRWTAAAT